MNSFFLPVYTLAWREIIRFVRQRNRLVGAFLQPIVFFVLFGQAFSGSFKPPAAYNGGFQEYVFPGTIVLVAPVPRLAMVLGKILGGTILAVFQAAIFFCAVFFLKLEITPLAALQALGLMFVIGLAMTALGFTIAWRMESTQGFHAIMSVFLLPMWLLSGAIFPAEGAPVWLAWMIKLNPLSYGLAALRQVLYPGIELPGLPSLGLSLGITFAFAAVTIFAAAAISRTRTTGDLH
jgi:ABC-2 type transport system permease protein